MSNNKEILDLQTLIKELILLLEQKGLLDIDSLLESLGVISPIRIIPVYYRYRLDYKKVAEDLKRGLTVLLPISRKNAYHLRRRLKQLLGKEPYVNIVYVSNKKYYVFSLSKFEEVVATGTQYIKRSQDEDSEINP
jgi:hypothetical protein